MKTTKPKPTVYRNTSSQSLWRVIATGPDCICLRACDEVIVVTPRQLKDEFEIAKKKP